MRVTKILGSMLAVGIAVVALTTTTESSAGDESLVNVSCSGGNVTAKPVSGWHTNAAAPWKWVNGSQTIKPSAKADSGISFTGGGSCGGTLSAFVCKADGTQCKGPISVTVH